MLYEVITDVNTLLAGLTFTPALDYNSNFTIATSVDDGIAPAVTGNKAMTGTAVNDAPVVTADASTAYTQNAPAVVVDSSVPVTDVDDVNIESATITVSNVDRINDLLTATGTVNITVTPYDSATGVLFLSGTVITSYSIHYTKLYDWRSTLRPRRSR